MTQPPPSDPTGAYQPSDDPLLDAGLQAAFGPDSGPPIPAGSSVLAALEGDLPSIPRVHLREPEAEPVTPVNLPDSPAMPPAAPLTPFPSPPGGEGKGVRGARRLQLLGEIARGGMGAILKGRDVDLGRDVAVKVLLETHQGKTELAQRFVEEAQIAGQLQHPGIVPVYELGVFADRRPYFTMKLVKGKTLAALLTARKEPSEERAKHLGVFVQVCQTLAYAHARGVIHRDLKPTNVMVGAYGEVQVMDWGLAKVLRQGGAADEVKPVVSVIRTARSEKPGTPGVGSDTQAGTLLGTPAYMAPEQARGDVDLVDERSDVFGLGAILCEILTGRPPFAGKGPEAARRSQLGQLEDAFARLDGCGADGELVALAKRCLAAEPWDRPRDAGHVAEEMAAYQSAVAERLRQAELARAAEEARAVEARATAEQERKAREAAQGRALEERKRRRLTVALAATVLLAVSGAGAAALWYQHDKSVRAADHARQAADTERDVTAALEEAESKSREAAGLHNDPVRWEAALTEALSAVKRAEGVLNSGVDDTGRLKGRAASLRADLGAAERDRRMVGALEEARIQDALGGEFMFDPAGTAKLYGAAFRQDDKDWDALGPEDAAARINHRGIREEMLAALDDWAAHTPNKADADRIRAILQVPDPDPASFRNRCRVLLEKKDWDELQKLVSGTDARTVSPATLLMLSRQIVAAGGSAQAGRLLEETNEKRPGDFWIALTLGVSAFNTHPDEAIRYLTAALMVRPDSAPTHGLLGEAFYHQGHVDEAIVQLRRAVEIRPDLVPAHISLGDALSANGRPDEAITEYRRAIELQPGDKHAYSHLAHLHLANALVLTGRLDEATAECRKAAGLKPDFVPAHFYLAIALRAKGRLDEAITEYRTVIDLAPGNTGAHNKLGELLATKGQFEEAVAEWRTLIEITTDSTEKQASPAPKFLDSANVDDAITQLRQTIQLRPDLASAHGALGAGLYAKLQFDEALVELRKAVELKPDFAAAHSDLGAALHAKGLTDMAIAEYRKAIALAPESAETHNRLGNVIRDKHQLDEAIAELRKAIALQPDLAKAHHNLGLALCAKGRLDEGIAELRKAIELKPNFAYAHANLGFALRGKGLSDEEIAEYRKAIELKPDFLAPHVNLAQALDAKNQLDEAINEYSKVIELKPDNADAHFSLGKDLKIRRRLDEAAAEYRTTIELKPDYAEAHCNLGQVLRAQGRFAESLAAYRSGHQLGSQNPAWRYPSEKWVREAEELARLEAVLSMLLHGDAEPASAAVALHGVEICESKRLNAGAAQLYAEAFARESALADNLSARYRYDAACSAARAACGLGVDAASTDAEDRNRWRSQSLEWLRADLALWTRKIDDGETQDRTAAAKALQNWIQNPDLAGVRDADALAKLPSEEQDAWRRLWVDVDAAVQKAAAK